MTQLVTVPLPDDEGTFERTDGSRFEIAWRGLDRTSYPGWYWWNCEGDETTHGPYSQLALAATCAMFNDPEAV